MSSKNTICLRCSAELKYNEYGVTLVHLKDLKSSVATVSEDKKTDFLISFLLEKTNGDIDVITEYVTHHMNRCTLKVRNCPECGNRLKTWRAKLCLECGAEFEPLYRSK